MRHLRRRVTGAAWKFVVQGPWDPADGAQVGLFTAIPRTWEFDAPSLTHANARRLKAWFRTELNRCGAPTADGWLIAFIHGEWEPNEGMYRLHVHGVAAGGMLAVVDRLRRRPHFAPPAAEEPADVVVDRVRMSRKPITNLPYALSYVLKSYWPARWIGVIDEQGRVVRVRRARRIAEPHHTQVLLWLDKWRLSDITLLMKIHVGKQGFVLTASQ